MLYSVTKNAEGAHGGAPAVSLPASVVVDYTVRGTCDFTVAFQPPTGPAVKPAMSLSVRGEASGTASFALVPGPYAAVPGEAVGCTFTFVVRQPG